MLWLQQLRSGCAEAGETPQRAKTVHNKLVLLKKSLRLCVPSAELPAWAAPRADLPAHIARKLKEWHVADAPKKAAATPE
eukprot:9730629-Alexandrium_andersonii.AAC.1